LYVVPSFGGQADRPGARGRENDPANWHWIPVPEILLFGTIGYAPTQIKKPVSSQSREKTGL
jgi:hypothetical protein